MEGRRKYVLDKTCGLFDLWDWREYLLGEVGV